MPLSLGGQHGGGSVGSAGTTGAGTIHTANTTAPGHGTGGGGGSGGGGVGGVAGAAAARAAAMSQRFSRRFFPGRFGSADAGDPSDSVCPDMEAAYNGRGMTEDNIGVMDPHTQPMYHQQLQGHGERRRQRYSKRRNNFDSRRSATDERDQDMRGLAHAMSFGDLGVGPGPRRSGIPSPARLRAAKLGDIRGLPDDLTPTAGTGGGIGLQANLHGPPGHRRVRSSGPRSPIFESSAEDAAPHAGNGNGIGIYPPRAKHAHAHAVPPSGNGMGGTIGSLGSGLDGAGEEEDDEEENLMIGEIHTVKLGREARALLRYLRYSLVLVVPCLLVHLLHKFGVMKGHYTISNVSVLYWSLFFSVALLSLPFLRFTARLFAYCAMQYGSKLLYRSNALYFAVALHYDVSLLSWSVFLLVAWRRVLLSYIDEQGGNASSAAEIVDNCLTSYVAFRVGWLVRNFLVLLIATKYLWRPYLERVQSNIFAQYVLLMLTDYVTRGYLDRDDERFALQISNRRMKWTKLSLYAVSKAIGFIPRHKLGHEFFKNLLDNNETELDSAKEARVLGNFLFEQLVLISCHKHPRFTATRRGTLEDSFSRLASSFANGSTYNTVTKEEDAKIPTAASVFAGNYLTIGRAALGKSPPPAGKGDAEEKEELAEVLERVKHLDIDTFCPLMHPALAAKAFAMFDTDGNGEATREEMVQGVVHTIQDHKSLALTLRDSQHIAIKLGQLMGAVIIFILLFVWLTLWGYDVKSLTITFASFLVAIAFMIGNAASNLVISIIYVFVMRMYDVGDRVMVYDDKGVAQNCVVVKINLLLTEFKRWDEQTIYVPNNVLSTRMATNMQRSGHQWHEFFIQIASATSSEKIGLLRSRLQDFAKENDNPQGIYGYMIFALVGIQDSTKLTVRICFRQKSNFQDLPRYWAQHSICTQAIKEGCDELSISYAFPELPVGLKQKLF